MECRVKVIITNGDEFCLGPGIVRLLKEIGRTGQVSVASRNLGISYSKAWKMIRSAESGFGEKMVVRSSGGSSGGSASLSDRCLEYIAAYDAAAGEIEEHASAIVKKAIS